MSALNETSQFDDVYRIEKGDKVTGGPEGTANKQIQQLVNRTRWLKDNIPTPEGKANADGATATPTAGKVPVADADGKLNAWISDASVSTKGKVALPNASGFAPMPLDAGAIIGPSTTGLTVGKRGPYRSDGAFTLPAGGTWEYDIEQKTAPIVQKAPGTALTTIATAYRNIKHLGSNYFAAVSYMVGSLIIYKLANNVLTEVATYPLGGGTTGLAILQEWNGSTARLVTMRSPNDSTTCTTLVLVFNGTTIALESTNELPIAFNYYYIACTGLTATRLACICGSLGADRNKLYTFDYDISAKTWAQVGNTFAITIGYYCGLCKLSETEVVLADGTYSVRHLAFDGTNWSLVGAAYSLFNNHNLSGSASFFLPLGNNRLLGGYVGQTVPTAGIVLWWDATKLIFRPMSPVIKIRSSSVQPSSWGYGLGTLLSLDANDNTASLYDFPAGELTSRLSGTEAGGTTLAAAELACAYIGSVKRIQ